MWTSAYPDYTERLAAMAYHANTLGARLIEGLALEPLPAKAIEAAPMRKAVAFDVEMGYRVSTR